MQLKRRFLGAFLRQKKGEITDEKRITAFLTPKIAAAIVRRGVDGVQIGEIAVVLESAQLRRKDRTYMRPVSAITSGLLADKRSPGGDRLGTCQTSK